MDDSGRLLLFIPHYSTKSIEKCCKCLKIKRKKNDETPKTLTRNYWSHFVEATMEGIRLAYDIYSTKDTVMLTIPHNRRNKINNGFLISNIMSMKNKFYHDCISAFIQSKKNKLYIGKMNWLVYITKSLEMFVMRLKSLMRTKKKLMKYKSVHILSFGLLGDCHLNSTTSDTLNKLFDSIKEILKCKIEISLWNSDDNKTINDQYKLFRIDTLSIHHVNICDMVIMMKISLIKSLDLVLARISNIPMKEEKNGKCITCNYVNIIFPKTLIKHLEQRHDFSIKYMKSYANDILQNNDCEKQHTITAYIPIKVTIIDHTTIRNNKNSGCMIEKMISYNVNFNWLSNRHINLYKNYYSCGNMVNFTFWNLHSRRNNSLLSYLYNGNKAYMEYITHKGVKIVSHALVAYNNILYIQKFSHFTYPVENPPSIIFGRGGFITDYRITEFINFMKMNRLAPVNNKSSLPTQKLHRILNIEANRKRSFKKNSMISIKPYLYHIKNPIHISLYLLNITTKYWPMAASSSLIFNLKDSPELFDCLTRVHLNKKDYEFAKEYFFKLKHNQENNRIPVMQNNIIKQKSLKREDRYITIWNEFKTFLSGYTCISDKHKQLFHLINENFLNNNNKYNTLEDNDDDDDSLNNNPLIYKSLEEIAFDYAYDNKFNYLSLNEINHLKIKKKNLIQTNNIHHMTITPKGFGDASSMIDVVDGLYELYKQNQPSKTIYKL